MTSYIQDAPNLGTGEAVSLDDRLLLGDFTSGQPLVDRQASLREVAAAMAGEPRSFSVDGAGAVGNGVADDAPTIQAVINAAHAAGGGTVWLGARIYRCHSDITVKSGVILRSVADPGGQRPGSNFGATIPSTGAANTLGGALVMGVAGASAGYPRVRVEANAALVSVIVLTTYIHLQPPLVDSDDAATFAASVQNVIQRVTFMDGNTSGVQVLGNGARIDNLLILGFGWAVWAENVSGLSLRDVRYDCTNGAYLRGVKDSDIEDLNGWPFLTGNNGKVSRREVDGVTVQACDATGTITSGAGLTHTRFLRSAVSALGLVAGHPIRRVQPNPVQSSATPYVTAVRERAALAAVTHNGTDYFVCQNYQSEAVPGGSCQVTMLLESNYRAGVGMQFQECDDINVRGAFFFGWDKGIYLYGAGVEENNNIRFTGCSIDAYKDAYNIQSIGIHVVGRATGIVWNGGVISSMGRAIINSGVNSILTIIGALIGGTPKTREAGNSGYAGPHSYRSGPGVSALASTVTKLIACDLPDILAETQSTGTLIMVGCHKSGTELVSAAGSTVIDQGNG